MRFVGAVLVNLSLPAFMVTLRSLPKEREWAYLALGVAPFALTMVNADAAVYQAKKDGRNLAREVAQTVATAEQTKVA